MDVKRDLVKAAKENLPNSYAPYSSFNVSAAVLTANGEIFTGVNIENVAFSVTVCAERVALFSAIASGNKEFEAMAIASNDTALVTPCGSCRQVLSEFVDTEFKIYLINNEDKISSITFSDIYKNPFNPNKNLKA